MKLKVFILLAVIFSLLSFKTEKTKLNGTWKIVSQEYIRNGVSTIEVKNENNSGLKTWSDSYYRFVSSQINGSMISNSFGGGKYELSGSEYTEYCEYHVAPNYHGRILKLYLEINGDTLMQVSPCDDNFNYDINNCTIEKYVRVD